MFTLICAAMAFFFTYTTMRFLQTARHVRGELVDYKSYRDNEGDWLHHPVFRFTDASGQTITASNPRTIWVVHQPSPGQEFELVYNPADPAQVWRNVWYEVWFGPLVLWAVSVLGFLRLVAG